MVTGGREGEDIGRTVATGRSQVANVTRGSAGRIAFWVLLCAALVTLLAGGAVVLSPFRVVGAVRITSPTMANTLRPGDRLLYADAGDVRRGDLVIARVSVTEGRSGLVVGRVIGLPGDQVACCAAGGKITINGTVVAEDYLYPGDAPSMQLFSITLARRQLWLMGDRRSIAFDSRYRGPVSSTDIVGRVVLVIRGGSLITVRTPHVYIADHLAPADTRTLSAGVLIAGLAAIAASVITLIALAAIGIARAVIRRRRTAAPRTPRNAV